MHLFVPMPAIVAVVVAAQPATPTAEQRAAIAELGLTPSAFAVCGVSAPDAQLVVRTIIASDRLPALCEARAAAAQCASTLIARKRDLALATTPESKSEAQAEIVRLTSRKAELEQQLLGLRNAVFADGIAALSDAQLRLVLTTFRDNSPELPEPLRVVAWNGTETKALLAALASEKKAAVRHDPVPEEAATLLLQARGRPAVQAATGRQSNASAIGAALAAIGF